MSPIPLTTENTEFTEEGTENKNSVVENEIILEIKSVEKLAHNHDAQILNYMRLGEFKLGLLMNFNEMLLKNGLKRFKI